MEGEDSENVSDDKEDDEVNPNLKYIKKEEGTPDKAVLGKDELNNNLHGQRVSKDDQGIKNKLCQANAKFKFVFMDETLRQHC